jgi:uncharacterized damage-inducible protein DinB
MIVVERLAYTVAMSTDAIAHDFLAFAVLRLQRSEHEIARCCDQLTEEQMWRRGGDHENSVANLLLHLEGNLRQWVLHGMAGQPDVRKRDDEFALTPTVPAAEARARFAATVAESCEVLRALAPARLPEVINPQPGNSWGDLTIIAAIFQVVAHVQMHNGQIMLLTKQMLGRDLDLSLPRKR